MTLLTPTQASELVGVPAVQLCRWAYIGHGPRNSGTKHKPMFDEDDLQAWREMLNRPRRCSQGIRYGCTDSSWRLCSPEFPRCLR
jgi:hypothetical protein